MTLLVPEFLPVEDYTFARLRRVFEAALIQEGVFDPFDLLVSQRGAGVNKSVDITAGRAWVRGDDTARQGSYHCENDGTINLAIPDNTSGNPRIDQIILRIYDSSVIGGGTNAAVLEVLQGTPTAGAALDNRQGAAALPATAIRLADIVVASGFASISNTVIRNRRPWARGAFWTNSVTAGDRTRDTSSKLFVDGVNLNPRIECSGNPIRVTTRGNASSDTAGAQSRFDIATDGASISRNYAVGGTGTPAGQVLPVTGTWVFTPTVGSHTIGLVCSALAGVTTIFADAIIPFDMTVEEILRSISSN